MGPGNHDAFWILDYEYRYTYLNDQAVAFLGSQRVELLGKSVWDLYPDLVGGRFYNEIHRISTDQTVVQFEDLLPPWNRWFEIRGYLGPSGIALLFSDITKRKEAEEDLKRQAQIIDQIHDAVVSTDLDGNVTSWNQGAEKLYGFRTIEALGRHISFVYPEEEREFLEREVIVPLKEKGTHATEVRMRKKSGEEFYANLLLSFLRDGQGSVNGMIGYTMDITGRKQAEENLRARARQQAALADLGQKALEGVGPTELMDQAVEMIAKTLDVEFSKIQRLLPGGDVLLLQAGVGWPEGLVGKTTVRAGLDSQSGFTLSSGQPVIVEDLCKETRFQGSPLLHAHGVVSGVSVIILGEEKPFGILGAHTSRNRVFSVDDTHFLEAVANVLATAIIRKRNEDKFRDLLESAPDAMVIVDEEGTILLLNAETENLFGYKREELIGKPVDLLIAERFRNNRLLNPANRSPASSSKSTKIELELNALPKEGKEFPVEVNVNPLENETGVLFSAAFRDISERKRAEILRERFTRIHQSHDAMVSVLNQLNIAAVMTDEEGRVTFLSQVAEHLFEKKEEDIRGKHWEALFASIRIDLKPLRKMNELLPELRRRVPMELSFPGARSKWVEAEVQDKHWDPQMQVIYFHDVTEVYALRTMLSERTQFANMVGKSEPMQRVFHQIREVSEVDSTVLIEGETGTGKELVARAIHFSIHRKIGQFVPVNCAALSDTLLESQLFGHRKGSFTGAFADQKGLFEAAHGGSIFLDEIGDLSQNAQSHLLRVLQEREVVRVGETRARKIDVRILVATNKSLDEEVRKGNFRADLLYRIKIGRVWLPPLRARREDIPLLVRSFLRQIKAATSKRIEDVSADSMRMLLDYDWPGNVRELQNVIEFASIRSKGSVIQTEDLPLEIIQSSGSHRIVSEFDQILASEKERLLDALTRAGGNRTRAARLLGIGRSTLYRLLAKYDLSSRCT